MHSNFSSQHQTHLQQTTMKTLVVLSFLVGVAIAAPASQEKALEVATKEIASKTPDLIKREKKSPQLQDDAPSLPEGGSGFQLPADFNADVDSPTASARSFGLKKDKGPIIVKKKSGFHLYRDSEEERAAADPTESCGKQLRVKVCNVKASGKSADLAGQNAEISNNDVENSIQVAKEAIESLEKDMQKLEQTGHWKHGKSEEDTSMHHNIETVRQALQQVQGRIGKLEVMNLQAKTVKNPLALDDITKGKSEEERLAQWKEAMENIQKNVEVARNIEDSFKSADEIPEEINHKFMKNADQEHNNNEMSAKSTSSNLFEQHALEDDKDKNIDSDHHKPIEKSTSEKLDDHEMMVHALEDNKDKNMNADHHKPIEKSTSEKLDDHEMMVAASEPIESKVKHDLHQMAAGKSTEMSVDDQSSTLDSKHNAKSEDKKDRDAEKDLSLNNIKDDKNNELDKETAFRVTENKKHGLKPSVAGEHTHDIDNAAREEIKKAPEQIMKSGHLSKEKNAWDETQPEDNIMKTAEQTDMAKEATNEMKSDLERPSLKEADKMASNIHNEALKHDKHEFQMKHSDSDLMSTHNQGMHMSGHEMKMPGHGMHMQGHDMHKGGHEMGLVGHDMKMHGHDMHMGDNQHNMYNPKHGKHVQGYDMHMQGHDMHMQGHGMHMPGQGMHMSNPGHMRKHGKYGKSADLDNAMQPSLQMNMREASGKSAMDKMFQWKHHDSARAAYGGGYGAGGSDALGIFPNAKVGGCGIPLLLSCSPSVVQGSLAKSHSSYGSPAYRTEDDFSLKKKRDILKTKETKKDVTVAKVNPTATKKNIEILDSLN